MGFFDNFKEKATDLAQAGVAQSKRLAEIAKLKTANMGEEDITFLGIEVICLKQTKVTEWIISGNPEQYLSLIHI